MIYQKDSIHRSMSKENALLQFCQILLVRNGRHEWTRSVSIVEQAERFVILDFIFPYPYYA